jgi:hypothetical protein
VNACCVWLFCGSCKSTNLMDILKALHAGSIGSSDITAWVTGGSEFGSQDPGFLCGKDAWSFVVFFLNLLRDESKLVLESSSQPNLGPGQPDTPKHSDSTASAFDARSASDFPELQVRPAAAVLQEAKRNGQPVATTTQRRRIKPTQVSNEASRAVEHKPSNAFSSSALSSSNRPPYSVWGSKAASGRLSQRGLQV